MGDIALGMWREVLASIHDPSDNTCLFLQRVTPPPPSTLGVQMRPVLPPGLRGRHVSQDGH